MSTTVVAFALGTVNMFAYLAGALFGGWLAYKWPWLKNLLMRYCG